MEAAGLRLGPACLSGAPSLADRLLLNTICIWTTPRLCLQSGFFPCSRHIIQPHT